VGAHSNALQRARKARTIALKLTIAFVAQHAKMPSDFLMLLPIPQNNSGFRKAASLLTSGAY
jgi:hypothetical protein